ncbi:MAG TPA: hypothetical protein VIK55_06635 [Paludibacter sp.]
MKVYQLRLVLGKVANYDQNGKLKNQTITAKYGEMELENILTDQNWKKLGACEISCVKVYDHPSLIEDPTAMKAVNDRINLDIQQSARPKTEIELLKDQIALLTEKVNSPTIPVTTHQASSVLNVAKEVRESLFTEAKELGLNPAKNIKTELLQALVNKAKEGKVN